MRVLRFDDPPFVVSTAAVGGREERRGPQGDLFDLTVGDDLFGQTTWERAEGEMQRTALALALKKAGLTPADVDLLFAGDLQNQCVASAQGLSDAGVPYIGLFGACSTAAEGLGLAALAMAASKEIALTAVVSSSHNCAAERQFRTPLEYGNQRTPTAQWTATAAGCFLLGRGSADAFGCSSADASGRGSADAFGRGSADAFGRGSADAFGRGSADAFGCSSADASGAARKVRVPAVCFGRMVDGGITDAANMGAAMAPAAADTIAAYLYESGTRAEDYDAVVTGDLGEEGSAMLTLLLAERGYSLGDRHKDCGLLLYDPSRQDMHAGASGCGCIASLLSCRFIPDLAAGKMQRILAIGTGALMNPAMLQQGGSIIGVAHLVCLERGS